MSKTAAPILSYCVVSTAGTLLIPCQTIQAAREWRYLHLGHDGATIELREWDRDIGEYRSIEAAS